MALATGSEACCARRRLIREGPAYVSGAVPLLLIAANVSRIGVKIERVCLIFDSTGAVQ